MRHTRLRFAYVCFPSAMLLLMATRSATANYYELLRRIPESANAIILIDVERMLMSSIAMKEKWRDTANTSERDKLHFPINSVRYMLASKFNGAANFENLWDVGLIESIDTVSLPYVSKLEGGYLDSVDGQEVVYSPRNAFFVSLTPKIVGVSFPANRQDLGAGCGRSSATRSRKSRTISRMLSHWPMAAIRLWSPWISETCSPSAKCATCCIAESLAGKEIDLDAITKVIASIKGVTFTVEATERLNGKMTVDFGESPSALKQVAKALLFEAIEKNGMMLDDEIKNWRVLVESKEITLEGRLSTKGLRMLTDLIPFPTETVTLNQASPKPGETAPASAGSSSTADSKATTSKKYFQHVSLLVDSMRTDVRNAGSPKLARRMVDRAALEIDRLPVLNVDEELIAYGAGVSETFRNMRNLSKNASLDASYRQASMAANQRVRQWGVLWRRNLPFPLHIGDAKTGDSLAQVEPDGDLHHARGKDGGDSQENDAEVPGRVLIVSASVLDPARGGAGNTRDLITQVGPSQTSGCRRSRRRRPARCAGVDWSRSPRP